MIPSTPRKAVCLCLVFLALGSIAGQRAYADCDACSLLDLERAAFPADVAERIAPAPISSREEAAVVKTPLRGALWFGIDSLSTLGSSRGASDGGRFTFGFRLRSRYVAWEGAAHLGGGYIGRADAARLSSPYIDMGFAFDLRVYLLEGPVQPFLVGGVGLSASNITLHDPTISDECLGDVRVEVSGGGGVEFAVSDTFSIVGGLRVTYLRPLVGDVPYYVRNGESGNLWGLRGELRFVSHFDAVSNAR